MKILSSLLLLGLLSVNPAWASDPFASNWSIVSEVDGVKVWQHKANPELTGSWQEFPVKKKLDWSPEGKENTQKEYFKSLEDKKKKMLSFIGVTDWTVEQYKWNSPSEGKEELIVEGHYKDSTGKKIYFKELHQFAEDKTTQFLHTRPYDAPDGENRAKEFFDFIKSK